MIRKSFTHLRQLLRKHVSPKLSTEIIFMNKLKSGKKGHMVRRSDFVKYLKCVAVPWFYRKKNSGG